MAWREFVILFNLDGDVYNILLALGRHRHNHPKNYLCKTVSNLTIENIISVRNHEFISYYFNVDTFYT